MSQFVAAPTNQFFRLVRTSAGGYAYGTPWNNVRTVWNGSEWRPHDFDAENCMASQGCVAAHAHYGGRVVLSPNSIRNHQDDFSGGIGTDDLNVAYARLGLSLRLLRPDNASFDDALGYVEDGRFVIFAVRYDAMPDEYQLQVPGRFDHALGASHWRASDGTVLKYDSLGRAPRRVPAAAAIKAAAESLALREAGSRGRLFIGVTGVIPQAAPAVRWGADVRDDVKAAYSAAVVAAKLRALGVKYGEAINNVDLEAGLEKRGIDYGTSVQLVDVRALMA